MQAATRRSIHSAFVQLQLSSRYRRSPLLLRQLATAVEPANGIIVRGAGRGRVGSVRFLSCSVGVRSEGKPIPDEHAGAVNSGGAAEPEQGSDTPKNSSQPALPSPSTASSTTAAPMLPASPASSEIGKQSTDSGPSADVLSPQEPEDTSPQETSDENKSLTQQQQREPKPRGRPAGSGGMKRRQPTKAKEKELVLKPEVPAWFLRDGVLMVEDNLTRPAKLDVWITQERSKDPAEELTEVLEACQEGFPAEAAGQEAVVEQIATSKDGVSEVTTKGGGGGVADTASPPPSPAIEPDPPVKNEESSDDAAAATKSDPNLKDKIENAYGVPLKLNDTIAEAGKDNQLSVKVSLSKLVQIDHTLQPAFSGTQGVEEIVSSAARLGEDVESHLLQLSHESPAKVGKNRYAIHVYVWREIMAYVTAGLALPKASSDDSDVATKSHLLLRCPREGGVYFLDAIIEHVASLARADVVRIDPQDLEEMAGDFLGDTKYSSLSNITSQKLRSLGYDAQSQSQGVVMAREENQEEEEEEEEYRDNTETQATPCFTASTISSIAGLRALAVAVPILPGSVASNLLLPAVSPQTRDSDRRNEEKVYRLLEALIEAAATKRTQQDLAPTYIDPWHGDPSAPRDISQPPDSALQRQKTIIHLRDYIELQRTPQGATIIRMMHDIVSRKRSQGVPMMIIGTTSSCETSYSLQKGNLEVAQELASDAFERTILVPPAKAPTDDDLDSIFEFDWRARIREVNIRHLRDIIRRRSGDGQRAIELDVPGDWHFLAEVGGEGEPHIVGIDEDMWSFDRAQRVAVMAIGLYHKHFQSLRVPPQLQPVEFQENEPVYCQDVPLQEEYIPGILTLRNIASAVDAISQSDNFKFSWAATERRRLHIIEKEEKQNTTQTEDDDVDDLTESGMKKPKAASAELMKKLAKTCTPHEQKLLGGVINPEKLHVGFNSVRAPPETIEALKILTSLSLVRPEAFQYGVLATDRIPGVLLYGPPGTGKTLLAKAVAKESGATVLEVSGSEIFDMYVGEGEKNVKAIFSLATRLSPCVIFLDEADAILGSRSSSGTRTTHREIINQFLREWADLPMTPSSNTFLMVATNRPFDLDDAVLRRLPRRILVDLPSPKDRLEILKIHLKDESLDPGVDLERIAKATPLYSGSDLKNVCVSAALSAVREEHDKFVKEGLKWGKRRVLTKKHFDKALAEVGASVGEDMGSLAQMRKWDEKFGEGKGRKKARGMGFGNIGLGMKEGEADEGAGRVRKPVIY